MSKVTTQAALLLNSGGCDVEAYPPHHTPLSHRTL